MFDNVGLDVFKVESKVHLSRDFLVFIVGNTPISAQVDHVARFIELPALADPINRMVNGVPPFFIINCQIPGYVTATDFFRNLTCSLKVRAVEPSVGKLQG